MQPPVTLEVENIPESIVSWRDVMMDIALWTAAILAVLFVAFRLLLMWLFPRRPRTRR